MALKEFPPLFQKKKSLALVLSGGGARGIAHIGVLEVLEENKIPVDAIVGTSMGALIGSIYAVGKLNEFKEEIVSLSNSKLKSIFWGLKFRKPGTDPKKAIGPILNKYLKDKKIENLGISYTAVATDLKTGKEIYLNKGSLINAVLASICLPGLFHPIELGNRLLVDGGVVDPLPQKYGLAIARKVIAVNASPKKYIYRKNDNFYNIIMDASAIMSNTLTNMENILNLQKFNQNRMVFIQLNTEKRDCLDFYQIDSLIKIGRTAAKRHLNELIELAHN